MLGRNPGRAPLPRPHVMPAIVFGCLQLAGSARRGHRPLDATGPGLLELSQRWCRSGRSNLDGSRHRLRRSGRQPRVGGASRRRVAQDCGRRADRKARNEHGRKLLHSNSAPYRVSGWARIPRRKHRNAVRTSGRPLQRLPQRAAHWQSSGTHLRTARSRSRAPAIRLLPFLNVSAGRFANNSVEISSNGPTRPHSRRF